MGVRKPSEVIGETMRFGFFITFPVVPLSWAKGVWCLASEEK